MYRHFLVIAAIGLQASPVLAAPPVEIQSGAAQAQSSTASGLAGTAKVASADDANRLYVLARERYRARDLLGAIATLKQCYELTRDSNLLFNVGQVYRELDDCASAVDYYRQYLDEAPRGDRAIDARQYLTKIEPNCLPKSSAVSPTDSATPPTTAAATSTPMAEPAALPRAPETMPPNPPRHTAWTTVGWVSLGVAAVATVASVVLIPKTNSDYNKLETYASEVHEGQIVYEKSKYESMSASYERRRNWLIATGTTAGVSAAFGVIALTVLAPRARRESPTPSVSVVNGGAVVGVGWTL